MNQGVAVVAVRVVVLNEPRAAAAEVLRSGSLVTETVSIPIWIVG
jgi:hypothetical protein